MKHRKGLLVLLLMLMLLAAISVTASADGGVAVSPNPVVSYMPSSLTMYVGETCQLSLLTTKTIKWSSNNKKIAKVSKVGLVTAKKVGKTTIKAKVGKKTYKCKVTVLKRQQTSYVVQAGVYGWQYYLAKQFIRVRDYVSDAYWTYKDGTYTIIAGTFTDRSNAISRRNYLLANGISASVEIR